MSAKLCGGENEWSDSQFSKTCLEAWVVQAGVNLTIESRNYRFLLASLVMTGSHQVEPLGIVIGHITPSR
jgi:hypothetical protein